MSSMAELLAQMKAKKAASSNSASVAREPVSQPVQETSINIKSTMDALDKVKDKPIDYIGETIDSQPRKINIATEGEIIKNRILKLSQALEAEIPDYAHILHTIHKALSKDDELTHLLTDEEVGVLIKAMKLRKSVVLVEEKKSKSAKKALNQTTLDDIL